MTATSLFIGTLLIVSQGAADEHVLLTRGQGFFPVAIRLRDQRIAVVLRGGAMHLGIAGRLDMVFSADEGKTWTPPAVVVDSPLDDRNPALGQADDGALVVGYWRTANYDNQGRYNPSLNKLTDTWAIRSTDGGKTWLEPTPIDVADIGYGSPYGKIITLPDRSMLMAVYGDAPRPKGQKSSKLQAWSYLYRSIDHGKSWSRHATVGAKNFNETGILRLDQGTILAVMRSESPQDIWVTRSMDDGKTFSEPKQVAGAMVHPGDLIQLSDRRVLLVSGHRAGPHGVIAMLGDSDGHFERATKRFLVNDAMSTDCGYPSSVLLKDGRVMTAYYSTGSKARPEWGVHAAAVLFSP